MMQPAETKYEAAPQLDDRDDSSSSTEVDESLMGDAKNADDADWALPSSHRRQSRRTRLSQTWHSYRWLIDTVLLLTILGLVLRGQYRTAPAPADNNNNNLQIGGDFTGVRSQPFSQQITKFTPDPSFAPANTSEFFTDEVLEKWNGLMPRGMGFVWVNETHKYHDLPTPLEWPGRTIFTTSMTHHLHCLFAVVQTYSGLTSGHVVPDDHHWHVLHCFDYMRQAIMCSADVALEGQASTFPNPDDNPTSSDGWDSKHVCKDYGQVYEYLESVRPDNRQQIF